MTVVLISKNDGTPEWAERMARIQYAAYVDEGKPCLQCGRPYADVDDFISRNPRIAPTWRKHEFVGDHLVDDACWAAFQRRPR